MTQPPRVSVLVGVRDNAATVERAVRSVLEQTIGDLEVIVLDDGSRDASREVVGGIVDDRLSLVALPHGGIARTLNEGLRRARAPVVAIQDADDRSDPRRLERQLAVLEASGAAVVGCRMREVSPSGRAYRQRTGFAAGELGEVLLRFNPLPNSAAMFRRDAALAAGGYDPRYRYATDYDLWLRLAERHRVVMLDEVLATRTLGAANASARHERAQIAEAIVIRLRAVARRRAWGSLRHVAWPLVTLVAPGPLKRIRRRRRGQAP
jgi:glycosyltransferase involved in cell wall biosynthesis